MKFVRGASKILTSNGFVIEDVSLVLTRLERAVPHLRFGSWRAGPHRANVSDEEIEDRPIGEVLWKNPQRTEVEVALELVSIRVSTSCQRDDAALPGEDYNFLLELVDEAARLVEASLTGAMSVFEYGTSAVAQETKRLASLEENPVAIVRFIRSLGLESYENQRIPYGVILSPKYMGDDAFVKAFDNKRVKRLTDGFSTALISDSDGKISGYTVLNTPGGETARLPRRPWIASGLAERAKEIRGVGMMLLRSGDIIVVHKGRMVFSQRAGNWIRWSHTSILARLFGAWDFRGNSQEIQKILTYLYHLAMDLSFRRSGALLVVVSSNKEFSRMLISKTDMVGGSLRGVAEKSIDKMVSQKPIYKTDRRVTIDLASLDGGVIVNRFGKILAYGAMTKAAAGSNQGARTRAAVRASQSGIAIKVSSDGDITVFAKKKQILKL